MKFSDVFFHITTTNCSLRICLSEKNPTLGISQTFQRHKLMCLFVKFKSLNWIEKIKMKNHWIEWKNGKENLVTRVPTPQGKQGKWWKVIPDRENTANFGKTRGKHKEVENFKIESWSMRRKNYCVTSIVLVLIFKIHGEYTWKTEITKGKHRKFCFPRLVVTMFVFTGNMFVFQQQEQISQAVVWQ